MHQMLVIWGAPPQKELQSEHALSLAAGLQVDAKSPGAGSAQ